MRGCLDGMLILHFVPFDLLRSRDVGVLKGTYPIPISGKPFVPVSDGAGIVEKVGSNVTEWKQDDRVMATFNLKWQKGTVPDSDELDTLGMILDGMLTQWKVVSLSCVRRGTESPSPFLSAVRISHFSLALLLRIWLALSLH